MMMMVKKSDGSIEDGKGWVRVNDREQSEEPEDQTLGSRLHLISLSFQSLVSIGLQFYILVDGFDASTRLQSVLLDSQGQFVMVHVSEILVSVALLVTVVLGITKSKRQIVHTIQYAAGMYVLSSATSSIGPLLGRLGKTWGTASSSWIPIVSLSMMLLPLLIHLVFILFKPIASYHLPPNLTNKVCRILHCLSLLFGVAAILFLVIGWNMPIASVNYVPGNVFGGLSGTVTDVEQQLEHLVNALNDFHRRLDPCSKAVEMADNTAELVQGQGRESGNLNTTFPECFGDNVDWLQGVQTRSDGVPEGETEAETDCTDLLDGTLNLTDAISQREDTANLQSDADYKTCAPYDFDEPDEPNENSRVDEMCERIQCGLFFGTMLTLTALSGVPFVGGGAAAAKVSARVARKTVMFGKRLLKTANTIQRKRVNVGKAIRVMQRVTGVGLTALYGEYHLLWGLLPVAFIGLFCIFFGFWRRSGLQSVGETSAIAFIFMVLTSMNFGMLILSWFLIPYLDEVLGWLPSDLVEITLEPQLGLHLLQWACGLATLSGLFWSLFSAFTSMRTATDRVISYLCGCCGLHTCLGCEACAANEEDTEVRATNKQPGEGPAIEEQQNEDTFGGWALTAVFVWCSVAYLASTVLANKERALAFGAC